MHDGVDNEYEVEGRHCGEDTDNDVGHSDH